MDGNPPKVYKDLIEAFYHFGFTAKEAKQRIEQFWDTYPERHRYLQGVWVVNTEGVTTWSQVRDLS